MKKIILSCAALLLAVTIAGCSTDKTVATTTSGKITQEQLYNELKTQYGTTTLQTMLLNNVLEDQYGDKVSKKDTTAELDKLKAIYGDSFDATLKQSNITLDALKTNIRTTLLKKAAVSANAKFTDADYKRAFEIWTPKMTAQHILVADEATAKDLITKINAGEDFAKLAKENSTDTTTKNDGGKLPEFDYTSSLGTDFAAAAVKLKDGEVSPTPIQSQSGYHIVKMTKNPGKGKWEDRKKELKEILVTEITSDNTKLLPYLAQVVKKANVQIKEDDLKDAMAPFTQPAATSSSSAPKAKDSSKATSDTATSSSDSAAATSSSAK
ncbi:peptidylprolyl isomerase [Carnobacterium gallinarum]|uniref:peptidylprolyl isomerase n=1 Tax=Carnobacterium gallinarum TaxID=2749 RepID=UPI00054F9685|nr:peptidylprolyl isomerase [Carnobacterium gallinarum]